MSGISDEDLLKARREMFRLFAPSFYLGVEEMKLDARTVFTCWNALATVSDLLKDARNGPVPTFQGHTAEDLVEFVMHYLEHDPDRKAKSEDE